MLRRLLVIGTIFAPVACAGLLDLDPGTPRAAVDGGDAGEQADAAVPPDAAPRRCLTARANGFYCDDFDEPGRTDPSANEAKATDAPDKLSLVTDVAWSSPRSLQAKYLNTGFPRGYLSMPWKVEGESFHMTMMVRVAREGISVGDVFTIAELYEVAGRNDNSYRIQLTPLQNAIEIRLKQAGLVLAYHPQSLPYDDWHEITMRFKGRNAYLELDGDALSSPTVEVSGDYDVFFGVFAGAPVTVNLDDVEIGP